MFAGIGVAAGAFGAHALRDVLAPENLEVYDTAARYQLVHALALVFTGVAAQQWPNRRWKLVGWLFASGILVFSGSLYALSMSGIGWLGAITPIGGLCFLGGWVTAAIAASTGGEE